MSTMFATTKGSTRGYNPKKVDEFLETARQSFKNPEIEPKITAADIRSVGFDLVKKGYQIDKVDQALDRLEKAFLAKEVEATLAERGLENWESDRRELRAEILNRLERKAKTRFRKVSIFHRGYHPGDVDKFLDRMLDQFQGVEELDLGQLRSANFRSKAGGYSEAQVDAFLDAVAETLLIDELVD